VPQTSRGEQTSAAQQARGQHLQALPVPGRSRSRPPGRERVPV